MKATAQHRKRNLVTTSITLERDVHRLIRELAYERALASDSGRASASGVVQELIAGHVASLRGELSRLRSPNVDKGGRRGDTRGGQR